MTEIVKRLGPDGEWTAVMRWPAGEQARGPKELVVRPTNPDDYPGKGLSSVILRDLDIAGAIDELRRRRSFPVPIQTRQTTSRRLEKLSRLVKAEGITDTYLARLSFEYCLASAEGKPKAVEFLAERTGQTPSAIRNHLWRAGRAGILQRRPGTPGGVLTDKAHELLAKHGLE